MRIIAGKFRGRKLLVPISEKTRPTLDRIKEPLFSILTPHLKDAKVLDLFAGTGNLGIEAVSRGASFAWLNDMNKEALKLISGNVRLTQCEKCVKITGKEYEKCLKQINAEKASFDVIFLDPPYVCNYEEKVLSLIVEYNILNKNGIIVLESDKRKDIDIGVKGIELIDERTYGRVIIRFYRLEE